MSKKDKKQPAKKLSLKRETVRVLTATDLTKVGGGYGNHKNCSCVD